MHDDLLTPPEIVSELDKYVVAQDAAKRAVAVALRNRWRRLRVPEPMREEITPKNILMIGPTGVGKTEISRRLAKLTNAPFVKVEASKFTEVGYVGRDVESIIRDLVEMAYALIKEEEIRNVAERAATVVEERLLDLLLPGSREEEASGAFPAEEERLSEECARENTSLLKTREKFRELLRAGKLDERMVELETTKQVTAHMQVLGPHGLGEIEGQLKDMFSNMLPKQRELKKLAVVDARKILLHEVQESLIDHERVAELAVERAEETGIVFVDEVDKICGTGAQRGGPDVSREGVQRDLLPIVEGCTVSTKYGPVHTEHVLFIASGAFHASKPSDLMPEFQGRFPVRVELESLSAEHFVRILTEPKNALTRQYIELLRTEGLELSFRSDAIEEIAALTAEVNARTENVGARRLHTILEKLLEDVAFEAHQRKGQEVVVDRALVKKKLHDIVHDVDLSRFIL